MYDDELTTAVDKLLAALGVERDEHLRDTPQRVASALREQLRGYADSPERHLETRFPVSGDPGLIIQSGIDVRSVCAHHLLPFGGYATVAYRPAPGQDVVGLSKLTRVVYSYAARLQIQERIGVQVVDTLMSCLRPQAALCLMTCEHDCMRLRGVRSPHARTTTQASAGDWSASDLNIVQRMHAESR